MRTISNEFRDALRGVKELIGVVSYRTTGDKLLTQANEYLVTQEDGKILLENTSSKYKILTTEHSTMLATEANKLIATEKAVVELDNDNIISINIRYDGKLLNTICQSLQLECKEDIELNTKINVKIGVLVEDEYEYVDMGDFYNINPSEYQLDTDSYVITAYDRMYRSMIKYDNGLNFPCTHRECLESILNKSGIDFNIPSYANENNSIPKDYWENLDVTYRDILDELCTSGGFGAIIKGNKFVPKIYYDTQDILNGEDLQDSSVSIGEKYGPINLVEISNEEGILIEIGKDGSSIEQNGATEFNLGLNRILENDENGDYFQSVFNAIKGLEFYTYDLASTGVLVFEPLDMFSIKYHGIYPTILLNDSITLTTGLKEDLILEKPQENVETYVSSAVSDEKIKNAFVKIDKANGQIVLKATSDNRLVKAELNADADNGSEFNIEADQIDFTAHTFNLTTDGIKIKSNNFSVDEEGNMECKDARITGGDLILNSSDGDPQILITNEGSIEGSFANLQINGGGFQVYDKDTNDPYAGIFTFGNREYEIGPHSELYLGGEWGTQIFLDGLLGEMSGGSLHLGGGNRGDGFIEIMDENNTTPISLFAEDGSIECVSLTQTSKEENKKNFEPLKNALDIVNNTDIYKYNFNFEDDKDKKHIGFVIGDKFNYREEITSKKNDGADIYAMVSVLWQAVKEQQKEIKELKEALKNAN